MKVLLIVPDIFRNSGGIARYCRLVCKALDESPQVKKLDVIALHDAQETVVNSDYYSQKKGTYFTANSSLASFMWAISKAILTGDYDCYLIGHVNFATFVWFLSLFRRNILLVTFAYGIEVWFKRNFLRRIGILKADIIFVISHYTRKLMCEQNGIASDKALLLYNCLDPTLDLPVKVKQNGLLQLNHPNLLTVARLSKEDYHKGHSSVVKAVAQVSKQSVVHYYVVGRGELVPELKVLADDLEITSNVHFLGFVSDEELVSIYQQCDMFVMPSTKEGFGFVYAEAMAHGKPCIAGNQDASPEVVRHNESGIIVEPRNIDQLSEAILTLIRDEDLRVKFGERGRQIVEEDFSFAAFQQTMVVALQNALKKSR